MVEKNLRKRRTVLFRDLGRRKIHDFPNRYHDYGLWGARVRKGGRWKLFAMLFATRLIVLISRSTVTTVKGLRCKSVTLTKKVFVNNKKQETMVELIITSAGRSKRIPPLMRKIQKPFNVVEIWIKYIWCRFVYRICLQLASRVQSHFVIADRWIIGIVWISRCQKWTHRFDYGRRNYSMCSEISVKPVDKKNTYV